MAGVVIALLMFMGSISAWSGLAWTVANVPPSRPLAMLVSFMFAFVGVSTMAALGAWLGLRPHLEQGRLSSPAGYVAHSMLLAVIALFALWLQSLRMLTPTVA